MPLTLGLAYWSRNAMNNESLGVQVLSTGSDRRKIDDEISFLRVRLDLMTSIVARMRVTTSNREYDKMPGLKKDKDAAMGRFAD